MVSSAATTAGWGHGSHPLLAAVATIEGALDEATAALHIGTDPAWLSAVDQGNLLAGLARIEQRAAAMKLTVLTAVDTPDGPASGTGARSAADWLASHLHHNARRTNADARLGARVAARPTLAAAMLDGEASTDHARAVLGCLDALPADLLDAETIESAEVVLTAYCREFTPLEVSHLGRRVLETVAPEVAEAIEAERLARAEREAWRRTQLSTKPVGDGLTRVTADIPALHASILDSVLDTLANPTHPANRSADGEDADGEDGAGQGTAQRVDDGQLLSAARRRGQAFCTLLEHLDTADLPHRHGSAVSVTVLIDEQKLRDDLQASGFLTTTTGVDLTLEQGRRLLCNAGVWPAVIGGASVVLDAGRTRRLIDGAMRKAAEIAHPTCQARGCTVPAAWCDGHHLVPWSQGGTTRLRDVALLCGHHHRRTHDTRYTTEWSSSGDAIFHRRP